ncbi:MAG TPA: serine/threonine-protein kinase [Terriglobales bacterium]|nr:serine/threonine-protein kinase [Terriglobales bacterium]
MKTVQENAGTTTAGAPSAPRTDRLELVSSLGRGSVGQVHKARSPQNNRTAALRQFEIPQWLDDADALMKVIMDEARAASGLQHPNIARLYTCGYREFTVFMTAEFVEGKTLRETLSSRTPDLTEAMSLGKQLLAALDYAHEKGVFHHFLNTSNIKLLPDASLKLLDFGLLRDKNILTPTPVKKLEDQPYLSPEQVNNRRPDRAANLFSAATILYELFTTRNPFAGKHLGEVDRAITDANPHPPHVANSRVPEAVSRVLMRALAKNPADRYESGTQLFAALEAAMKDPRSATAAGNRPATGKFAAYETGNFNAAPATGKVPAMETGSFNVKQATSKPPAAPPAPATVNRNANATAGRRPAAAPANQWKVIGGVVACLVVLAALAMMFQRRPSDLPVERETVQTSEPAPTQAPPFARKEAQDVNSKPEAEPRGYAAHGSSVREVRKSRMPQAMTAPAPSAPSQGQLSVGSLPIGATVEIEGQRGQWQTPQTIGPLAPGKYKVTISKPGFSSETRMVQVAAGGRTPVDVTLTAAKGWITVGGSPSGAAIFIDGKNTGKITPAQLMLDPATHNVMLRKAGYLEASTDLKLAAGQAISYSPSLMVAGRTDNIRIVSGGRMFGGKPAADGMARIEIKSEPKGAQVVVNGTPLQKTTPVEIQVDSGSYDITLQKDGYKPVHESAIVGPDDHVRIDKSLSR